MKLCWLIADERSGGITSVALSCCRQAASAGHEVTLLMLSQKTDALGEAGIRAASLGFNGDSSAMPRRLIDWLEVNPQDMLFLNGCEEADAAIPFLKSSVKCIYVVHDSATRYWRTAIVAEKDLDAIVAVSETVAAKFRSRLLRPAALSVILNGCFFPPRPSGSVPRRDSLIFLGGDNPYKGAYDVLHLWKKLVRGNFKGDLHWFGDADPDFRKLIKKLPHSERVNIYGRVKRDTIFSTAEAAKVILVLTRDEAFGMSTIEAMSMGCLPVAWDIETGTKEIVRPDQTGLFAPLGSMQALVREVLFGCQYHSQFEAKVIESARSDFEEAVMWEGYESLIKRVALQQPIERSKQGRVPFPYKPALPHFQVLPKPIRLRLRGLIGRSPRIGHWLKDLRGW